MSAIRDTFRCAGLGGGRVAGGRPDPKHCAWAAGCSCSAMACLGSMSFSLSGGRGRQGPAGIATAMEVPHSMEVPQ